MLLFVCALRSSPPSLVNAFSNGVASFLFWEPVLFETDPVPVQQQVDLTPNRADGCHLNHRKTGDVIRAAGFQKPRPGIHGT